MTLSEMTKNDMSYIVDMLEGTKPKNCWTCRRILEDSEVGLWRTCSPWEESHQCKDCARVDSQRKNSPDAPDGVIAVLQATCRRCPQEKYRYPVRESGLCYNCETDTACPDHTHPTPKIGSSDEEFKEFRTKLTNYYWGKAHCAKCQDNRLPYRRYDYMEISRGGPWNEQWCFRCGGIQHEWNGGTKWYEEYDPKEFRFPWRTKLRKCVCNG